MILLLKDRKLMREIDKAIREKLGKDYSLDKHCKDIISIYENLLQKNIAEAGVL